MKIFFKIDSLGEGLGPNFILKDNIGLTDPYSVTKSQLLSGLEIEVNNLATDIFVTSIGVYCKDCCEDVQFKKYSIN